MITALNRKNPARIWKVSFFDVFDPGTIHPDRKIVFLLTGHSAGVTADASSVIDDKPEIGHTCAIIDLNGKDTKNILIV